MAQRQAAGEVGVQPAPAVDDRVIDRLQGSEAVADLGHMSPGLGGVVIHAGKDPDPAVDSGPGHGGVGAPALVGRRRDDRAVMGVGPTPATDPLGRQQPLPPEQAQHPFAADVHAVLATKPGPDLAIPLAGEG
jgi:hypothetical protein